MSIKKVMVSAAFAAALQTGWSLETHAQYVVYDPANHLQAVEDQAVNLAKYVQMVDNQVQQINNAVNTLNTLNAYVEVFGDPSKITQLVGLNPALKDLVREGGQTLDSINHLADSAHALEYDGKGLYQSVQKVAAGGVQVPRLQVVYKPVDAMNLLVDNYQDVQDDAKTRLAAIKQGISNTLNQLKSATTDAEVQKLSVVLQAQTAALSALQFEVGNAGQQALVQAQQNQNIRQRDARAQAEESAAVFSDEMKKFTAAGMK
jgi:cell fate (sporulation/competence/biofilm development) regulator YmcA (YheA/YmcA/DUF963 family)